MKARLAINAASGVVSLIVTIVAAFLLTPITVGALGNRDYGIWEVIVGLIGFVGLFDLGLGPALVRFFAFESARNEPRAVSRVFTTALFTLGTLGLAAFAAFGLLSLSPELLVDVEPGSAPGLSLVFLIVGANLMIKFPSAASSAYLLATQRHYFYNSIRAVFAILQAVAIWYTLTRLEGSGLIWLSSVMLVVNVIEFVLFLGYLLVTEPELRPRFGSFSASKLVELFRFGAKSLVGLLSARLRIQAIPLVIAQVVGVERVVFFALAHRLTEYAMQLGVTISRPLIPYWSDLYGRNDSSGIRERWFITSRLLQFIYCGMGVGVIFLGDAFVSRWMGASYGAEARVLIWITSSVLFFEGLAPNAFQVLVGMNKHGRAGFVLFGSALLGIGLAAVLGSRYDLVGVSVGYVIGAATASFGVMAIGCRAVDIGIREHLIGTLWPLVPSLAAEAGTLLALERGLGPVSGGYPEILGRAALGGTTYLAVWWLWTLEREERRTFAGVPRGVWSAVRRFIGRGDGDVGS